MPSVTNGGAMGAFSANVLTNSLSEQNIKSQETGMFDPTEVIANIFEPDSILPSQFFECSECGLDGGERKLMAAILSDGIEAYISQSLQIDGKTSLHRQEQSGRFNAIDWVDTKEFGYVFSFDIVCESLGIDSDYLRHGLKLYISSVKNRRKRHLELVASNPDIDKSERENKLDNNIVWKRIRRPRKK